MRAVKVKFHRTDVFNQLFNNDNYINNNKELIIDYSDDSMNFKDVVEGNTEQDARNNILTRIKDFIDRNPFLENRECVITHDNRMNPNCIWVHLDTLEGRLVCEIIEVKIISA